MQLNNKKKIFFLVICPFLLLGGVSANMNSKLSDTKEPTINYLKNFDKNDDYILGPGDQISIKVSNETPELSGNYLISGEGKIYIERLEEIFVEGLTVNELRKILQEEFGKYIYTPNVYIQVTNYRPVRVYLSGEVNTPGLYILAGKNILNSKLDNSNKRLLPQDVFPTIFDAIKEAKGITAYSNLKEIKITRRNTFSNGSGRIAAKINLLKLLNKGQFENNIRIYDQDTIFIPKSSSTTIEQLSKALKTNLNDPYINVYVTGRVNTSGITKVAQGSTLSDAIIIAGGVKVLKGPVLFLRYEKDGQIIKRQFRYKINAKKGSKNNPYLKEGDVIYVRDNLLTSSSQVISEVTEPIQGLFSVYGIYKAIND